MKTLVLATHNQGKVREIGELLEGVVAEVKSVGELGLPEPEETGSTFAENALLKARAAAQGSGLPALADDSGLAVNALGGAPGIYSARWAGPEKDFALAMNTVNESLNEFEDKSAAFVCALALVWPDGREEVFEGRADGHIVWPPRGDQGFGYDPIFVPDGLQTTFAEMSPAHKQQLSHRAKAFKKLRESGVF
ncbi:MAG: RdgB/HAM1 family non-canonical purine NTP pyrophosphatase [Alphaproteobacteria bacterium]|nr:RdgB/HAM1 family non-canonical purine NTP pyrophosphatase [Alphaproteobacteria bacterium]